MISISEHDTEPRAVLRRSTEVVSSHPMAKGKGGGDDIFFGVLFALAAVIAGAAFLERISRQKEKPKTFPCPKCGAPLAKNTEQCPQCAVKLLWD
jgi:hypothetical protein